IKFCFQAEDSIRDRNVTGVQTCAIPISNTVLNFSIELQKKGKKVLLFDLDIGMGNVDILLGKDAEHSIVDLFDDFMPIHDIIETGPKGLSYIAGGSSLNNLIAIDQYKLDYFFKQY